MYLSNEGGSGAQCDGRHLDDGGRRGAA